MHCAPGGRWWPWFCLRSSRPGARLVPGPEAKVHLHVRSGSGGGRAVETRITGAGRDEGEAPARLGSGGTVPHGEGTPMRRPWSRCACTSQPPVWWRRRVGSGPTGDVDLLRRLGASGFDWLAVDAQHGPVDRSRSTRSAARSTEPAHRSSCAYPPWIQRGSAQPWTPAHLGRHPVRAGVADAVRPPVPPGTHRSGERSRGRSRPCGRVLWPPTRGRRTPGCVLVMVETGGPGRCRRDRGHPGVDGLVGPSTLSLALERPSTPCSPTAATTTHWGRGSGGATRHPRRCLRRTGDACRLRAHGIHCLAVPRISRSSPRAVGQCSTRTAPSGAPATDVRRQTSDVRR